MGLELCSGLPFPFPVHHALLEFSTMTHLSWVALHGMVHSFIKLHEAVIHVIILVNLEDTNQTLCAPVTPIRDRT